VLSREVPHRGYFVATAVSGSAVYRKLDAKGHFSQENATSHDLKTATCESKPL
jgi:hypothetical protein